MQCAYKRGKPLQCADTMTMTPFALLFRNLTNDEFITIAERTIKSFDATSNASEKKKNGEESKVACLP